MRRAMSALAVYLSRKIVSQKPLPLFPLAVVTALRLHHESGVGCVGWLVRLFRGDVMDRPICLL